MIPVGGWAGSRHQREMPHRETIQAVRDKRAAGVVEAVGGDLGAAFGGAEVEVVFSLEGSEGGDAVAAAGMGGVGDFPAEPTAIGSHGREG